MMGEVEQEATVGQFWREGRMEVGVRETVHRKAEGLDCKPDCKTRVLNRRQQQGRGCVIQDEIIGSES